MFVQFRGNTDHACNRGSIIDSEEKKYVLVGTVHGAFADCEHYLPGMFVETDDFNVLEFLQKEVHGSGLYE